MKKLISLLLAAMLALSTLTVAAAAEYTDKDTVKLVQQALNDAGYDCGTPDGVAGRRTVAAITRFQTDKGLEGTGVIDDALLEALGLAVPGEAEQPEGEPEAEAGGAGNAGIPEEIVALTGGVPDSIWELADRYDLEALDRLYTHWDSLAMLKGLLAEGSYTFDPMGFEWIEGGLHVRDANNEGPICELTLTPSEAGVTAALKEPLPEEYSCKYYQLELVGSLDERGGKYTLRANYYYDSLEPAWCGVEYGFSYDAGDASQYEVDRSNRQPYRILIELPGDDGPELWRAIYDEAGNLTEFAGQG